MRVLHLAAASVVALGMFGQPARADDKAHVELGQDIKQEADLDWLRLACPNYVADEAKRREATGGQAVQGARYAAPPAVAKCERVRAGGRS